MHIIKNTKIIVSICILLTGLVTTMTSPLLTEFSQICNLNIDSMGIIFSCNTIGYLILSNFFCILTRKHKPQKIIYVVIIGYALALLLLPQSKNIFQLCILFFIIGGGNGSLMSLLTAYIETNNNNNTHSNVEMVHISFSIGAIIGPMLIVFFNIYNIAWFYLYFIIAIILLIISIFFIKEKGTNNIKIQQFNIEDIKKIITNKYIIIIALCIALYNGSEVGSWGWLSTNLKAQNISLYVSNLAVSIFWLAMAIGRILVKKFSTDTNIKKILFLLLLMSIISNILVLHKTNILYQITCIFLLGFSYSAICPLFVSLGLEKKIGDTYTTSSLLLSSGSIGIVFIPFFIGINNCIGRFIPLTAFIICLILFLLTHCKKINN